MTPPPSQPGSNPDPEKVARVWMDMANRAMGDAAREMEQDVKDFGADIERRLRSESSLASNLAIKAYQINMHMRELDEELAKGVEASVMEVKRLKAKIAADIHMAPRAYQEFQRDPAYREMSRKYAGKSFAPSATANISDTEISNYLERSARVSSQVQSKDVSRLLGGQSVGNIGGALMMRGEEGNVANLLKDLQEVNILKSRGQLSDAQYEQRMEGLKNKHASLLNIIKETNKNREMGVAIADRESERIKKTAHSGTSALRSILPERAARGLDKLNIFNQLERSEKAAAAGQKAMGPGAQMASMGLEQIAGALSKIMTVTGAASSVLAVVAKFISILDDARKAQAAAIPALTAGSGQMANGYVQFANSVRTGNKGLFDALSQTSEFYPLVNQSFATMSTLGYRAATSVSELAQENEALATAFMSVGVMGKAVGKDFAESQAQAAGFARALNLSGKAVQDYYRHYIALANTAKLSIDEFTQALGNVEEYSKMMGAEKAKNVIDSISTSVNGMTDNVKKMQAMGALRAVAGMDLTRQAGLAMAAGGRAGLGALAASGNPLGVLTQSVSTMMQRVSASLGKEMTPEKRLGMAYAAGQFTDPAIAKALFYSKEKNIENDELYKAVMGTSTKSKEDQQKLIQAAKEQYDPMEKGAKAMVGNTETLMRIYNLLDNTFKRVANSGIGGWMGLSSDMYVPSQSEQPSDIFSITPRTPSNKG